MNVWGRHGWRRDIAVQHRRCVPPAHRDAIIGEVLAEAGAGIQEAADDSIQVPHRAARQVMQDEQRARLSDLTRPLLEAVGGS